MSDALPAGILKLAKTMDVDPSRLAFLADVPPADLTALRAQVAESLFRADRHLFLRVAALAKSVPTAVAGKLSETVLPPLLAARTAEVLEPERAAELVGKLSDTYLADVSVSLDASRAPEVVAAIPAAKVAAIGAELARRGEWVVIGGFVSVVGLDTLRTSLAGYDGTQLLRIAFVMDDLNRLDAVATVLTDAQLDGVLEAAVRDDLWPEFGTLLGHLTPPRLDRLRARYAAAPAQVRAGFDTAVAAGRLDGASAQLLRS